MATSSTLKALKQEDEPLSPGGQPFPARSSNMVGRLETWRQSIWRRRWLSVATAWLLCVAGWAFIAIWPMSYSASAVIYADLFGQGGASEGHEQTSVAMLKDQLLADESLDKVRAIVPLEPEKSQSLRDDIMVRPTVPAVFVLAYEHKDPDTARAILDMLIKDFEARQNASSRIISEAARTLDQQIEDAERNRQQAEADLESFKRTNTELLRSNEERSAKLALLNEELASLEGETARITEQRDRVEAELARIRQQETDATEDEPRRSLLDMETDRQSLQGELAKLQERYADTHPYVVAILDAIETLSAEIDAQAARDGITANATPVDRDELEQQHGELIVEVTSLSSQLNIKREEIEDLQALTRTTTSVEAELSGLEAEKVQRSNELTALQDQRDELEDEIGGKASKEPVRLIKEPELPTDPVGPSRLMALAAVLIGGTGLGAANAVFFNRYKGVFESAWQLKQRFDVGVLGTISDVMTPAERKKRRHAQMAFSLACLALLAMFSGLVVAESTDRLALWGDSLRTQFLG